MADSFADLWNSTAPTKPSQPLKTLGSTSPQIKTNLGGAARPQYDAFSVLASAGSPSTSRPITPASTTSPRQKSAPPIAPSRSNGGDAFSDLFAGSSGAKSYENMTIAERAAQAERARKESALKQQESVKAQMSAWDGLDSLGSASSQLQSNNASVQDDDWGFGSGARAPSKTSSRAAASPSVGLDDDWGLGEFSTTSTGATAAPDPSSKPQSLWDDLDPVPQTQASNSSISRSASRSSTPGDFDFGDRGDRLMDRGEDSGGEDDLLGDLSKPVEAVKRRPTPAAPASAGSSRPVSSRPVSPPPHVIGQIVEMGFSPQQARIALSATDSGMDVQAALDSLLAASAEDVPSPPPRRERREQEDSRERADTRRRPNPRVDTHSRNQNSSRSPVSPQQANIQDQADKLLAQASEFGLNVFNRANAFWKEGREKVTKAYEEHSRAASAGGMETPRKDGRPRWMVEAEEHAAAGFKEEDGAGVKQNGGFRDGDDDEVEPKARPAARKGPAIPARKAEGPPPARQEVKTGDLFSDAAPVYRSPFRHGKPKASQPLPDGPIASSSKEPPPRAPSPPQVVQRKTVSASPSALADATKAKDVGAEKFKLGQYSEAEIAYSKAISSLAESHLVQVQLHNNRALTRLKTGDYKGAVEDCTFVINLIGADYHPAREAKVTKEDEGASVDLEDGLVKAWRRRAEAYEGREKWDEARKDWECIGGKDWAKANVRNEAVRGAGRCRRMMTAATSVVEEQAKPAAPKPKPRPAPAPARRGPLPPSAALSRLREANHAAESEDQERHELKDRVDSRLVAWKGGKETNIRALIASLDTVLWPELGWQKVGLHELVTPAQVKIRYTKAIAKLHPDKLNSSNTTVEQRMIANGVFGALNDAWNAFKQ